MVWNKNGFIVVQARGSGKLPVHPGKGDDPADQGINNNMAIRHEAEGKRHIMGVQP